MSITPKSETVLVTGGSGYVAGWMIVGLLRQGYRVRATLRSLGREDQVRAAIARQVHADDRLEFFAADLLSDAGWDEAVYGCDTVFHVASPMGQGEPNADLVRPARDGTLRLLRAASKHQVRRFVYTSSVVAAQAPSIAGEVQPRTDETTWTDAQQKGLSEYARSKTLAEKAAWDFIQQDSSGMTMATILPGMILGPVMAESVSGSLELIYRLLKGKVPALPPYWLRDHRGSRPG
ncbi:NAD-dependent epimerase/dehydratase family protein [Terriglobus sp.]|uniref:NAD-dependent epimerase/dehydratase family protein n=1 Tax=Terriglobus sp. TaxID=1889013 RepID=UPI003B00F53D